MLDRSMTSCSSFSLSAPIDLSAITTSASCQVAGPGGVPGIDKRDFTSSQTSSTGLPSGPSLSSAGSFDTSGTGQAPSCDRAVTVNQSVKRLVEGNINQEQAVLMASHPEHLHHGRYLVRLWRTSFSQLFGLEFFTAEARNGLRSGIFVSHDLPVIGMSRCDRLLSINGEEPRSVQQACSMMKQLLS